MDVIKTKTVIELYCSGCNVLVREIRIEGIIDDMFYKEDFFYIMLGVS